MADSESDLETEGLDLALETLCNRYCNDGSSLNSKGYCSAFCELVEEYTGQWQVPLPQLKVLRTALSSFTKAIAAFPDDCQHIHYVLSSLALSFFELLLFFSKEEYEEQPLKDILDSFLECHSQLLRHRNVYLHHVKLTIKTGGPWENSVLKNILKEADIPQKEVEDYLCSELPILFELRVRYLQACERLQEAMALSKSCLENHETGKHLFFHQAYLTSLYKASLHEHLLKEMAEINGRDAVEIICNTEKVEKDELLLSLCKAFLTQQLHNGDMYYIWDLVFIWSRLYLRTHPLRQEFLSECLQLASSATNVRAIFPFIKLVNTELGDEGIQVCVELCARALQLCDLLSDTVTQSLVCKTIAFLLPHDLEICRACALLVFCQERSLEAYRTVCLLYMHPDDELHPCNSLVRTCVRFHILQKLKERLCFDPEFWNLFTLRIHCLELISDKAMQDAVLNEMEEEEKYCEEQTTFNCVNEPTTEEAESIKLQERSDTVTINVPEEITDSEKVKPLAQSENVPKRRGRKRKDQTKKEPLADEVYVGDDPEVVYNIKPIKPNVYSLRHNHKNRENAAPVKFPFNRKREYLTRCVKSQLLKRKGRKKRWLQGVGSLDPEEALKVKKILYRGKKRGRKPLSRVELSYPDNEILLAVEFDNIRVTSDITSDEKGVQQEQINDEKKQANETAEDLVCNNSSFEQTEESQTTPNTNVPTENHVLVSAVEADPELDGPPLHLMDCAIEVFHNYCLNSNSDDDEKKQPEETTEASDKHPENTETVPSMDTEEKKPTVKGKITWQERLNRTQKYAHIIYSCKYCLKQYRGLNVLRHALSHMKRNRKCVLCGKRFQQFSLGKKHISDHIEEMSKQKPSENNEEQKKGSDEQTPTTNGLENPTPEETPKPALIEETKQGKQKPYRSKLTEMKREDRIIRHLRILFRKTAVLHKNKLNLPCDFTDEQVVIKDDVIILKQVPEKREGGDGENEKINTSVEKEADKGIEVKSTSVKEEEGAEKKENPVKENLVYYLCPGEGCDRVFLKIGPTMTKHALKFHLKEERVQEKIFSWTRKKCTLCCREMQSLQHFKDHMKLHLEHPQCFCYHQNCNQRFATPQELRAHESQHSPFRPQCTYPACESLFSSIYGLSDHEWRHYIPTPQKADFEPGPNKQIRQNAEAPWKQRVKVEELWLQNKNSPREEIWPRDSDKNELDACKSSPQSVSITSDGMMTDEANPKTVNGFANEKRDQECHPPMQSPPKKHKKVRPDRDPLDVKDHDDICILSSGCEQTGTEEPFIEEHKTFKPSDPAYAPLVKAPLVRPPPSTYMKESALSMRKRKMEEVVEAPIKQYRTWNQRKKEYEIKVEILPPKPEPESKIRHRCEKCLSFFATPEDLEKHKSLNSCSALFGFDSDDES